MFRIETWYTDGSIQVLALNCYSYCNMFITQEEKQGEVKSLGQSHTAVSQDLNGRAVLLVISLSIQDMLGKDWLILENIS